MNVRFSPKAAIEKFRQAIGLGDQSKVIRPEQGVLHAKHEEIRYGQIAEDAIGTNYFRELFGDFLEIKSERALQDFRAGEIDQKAFFYIGDLLKDIAEHPYKLIQNGRRATAQISEWEKQGLTEMVAAADAELAEGDAHGRY